MYTENKDTGVMNRPEQEIQETEPAAKLTKQAIATIKEQMDLAENLVSTMMRFGIDYGITPGTNGPGLWDAGASKVIRAFRLFPDHKILYHEENDDIVSYVIQVHLINQAGEIFGSGMGAASTKETKFKYRWVKKEDAIREGYTEEDIAGLKTKSAFYDGKSNITYRIQNPEYGELVNTILAMASKRAEVDAARGLPGVGSALKSKFEEKPQQAGQPLSGQDDISLPIFWSIAKAAGLTEEDVHRMLNVKSLKDWKESGKTYRAALEQLLTIAVKAGRSVKKTAQTLQSTSSTEVKDKTAKQIDKGDIVDVADLLKECRRLWQMDEAQVWSALGFADVTNFKEAAVMTPWEAFDQIRLLIKA